MKFFKMQIIGKANTNKIEGKISVGEKRKQRKAGARVAICQSKVLARRSIRM